MEEGSSEMSTEKMSVDEKPEVASSADKSGVPSFDENTEGAHLQKGAYCLETKSDQARTAEQAVDTNAEDESEDIDPTSKFMEKDPLDLVPYIEKYVIVQLERHNSYVGFVHSIDPISHSVILSVPIEGGGFQTTFIPGTSVVNIREIAREGGIQPPKRRQVGGVAMDDLQQRKKKIISWLKENRLPVSEEGDNVVFGLVTLLPPYGEKDVSTTNPVVALEIQKIIRRMPANYLPK